MILVDVMTLGSDHPAAIVSARDSCFDLTGRAFMVWDLPWCIKGSPRANVEVFSCYFAAKHHNDGLPRVKGSDVFEHELLTTAFEHTSIHLRAPGMYRSTIEESIDTVRAPSSPGAMFHRYLTVVSRSLVLACPVDIISFSIKSLRN